MRRIIVSLVAMGWGASASAGDWPAWRGPTGQGHCPETNLPLTWSKTANVKWKASLPLPGNSTPIVWSDKIFLTQADKEGSLRGLLCLARADGKILWQRDVAYEDRERAWGSAYCNASPATDGQRVVVSFASAGLYCYDFAGKELWKRTDLGKFQHVYGNGSSPVLHGDLAILVYGPNERDGRNGLLAVDKKTGETVWEHKEKGGFWGTPLLIRENDQDQLLTCVPGALKGLDPKTGKDLWSCSGLSKLVYTSPLFSPGIGTKADAGIAVAMSGYGGAALAVKLGGKGDISANRLWHHPKNTQRVGSGVIVGEFVYILEENGAPHCYELTTGKEVWQAKDRPTAISWSSMVHAQGRLYVLTRSAETLVFAASPKYDLLARNPLEGNEKTNSSLAVSDGELFIRTNRHLYCIREMK